MTFREHILADWPELPKRWNEMIIFTDNLAYTIEFPNYPAGSFEYLKKFETLRQKDSTEIALLNTLDFHSNLIITTSSQSFTLSENERSVYFNIRKIALSSFGTLRLMKNPKNGKFYIKKTIFIYSRSLQPQRKRKQDSKMTDDEKKEKKIHKDWFKNFQNQMKLLQIIDYVSLMIV